MGDGHSHYIRRALGEQGRAGLVLSGQGQQLETEVTVAATFRHKKKPRICGAFVSESTTLRVVWWRRLNLETSLVSLNPSLALASPGYYQDERLRILVACDSIPLPSR